MVERRSQRRKGLDGRRSSADGTGLRVGDRNALTFSPGKLIASYLGLVPEEKSSGERRRLGHLSKQGNVLLRFLLVEAAQVTVRSHQEWRNRLFHLANEPGQCLLGLSDRFV